MISRQKLADFIGRKYLNEIVREIIGSVRMKKGKNVENFVPSITNQYNISILVNPADVSKFPRSVRALCEKAMVQSSFFADQKHHSSYRQLLKEQDSDESSVINHIITSVDDKSTDDALPELGNLLFRSGMSQEQHIWQILEEVSAILQNDFPAYENDYQSLQIHGKIYSWKKNFTNLNHRIPELFALVSYMEDVTISGHDIKASYKCSDLFIGRNPPYHSYLFMKLNKTNGLIFVMFED